MTDIYIYIAGCYLDERNICMGDIDRIYTTNIFVFTSSISSLVVTSLSLDGRFEFEVSLCLSRKSSNKKKRTWSRYFKREKNESCTHTNHVLSSEYYGWMLWEDFQSGKRNLRFPNTRYKWAFEDPYDFSIFHFQCSSDITRSPLKFSFRFIVDFQNSKRHHS